MLLHELMMGKLDVAISKFDNTTSSDGSGLSRQRTCETHGILFYFSYGLNVVSEQSNAATPVQDF